jgi:hypothetical protein
MSFPAEWQGSWPGSLGWKVCVQNARENQGQGMAQEGITSPNILVWGLKIVILKTDPK